MSSISGCLAEVQDVEAGFVKPLRVNAVGAGDHGGVAGLQARTFASMN
jgi:hypothetical protein